MNLDDDDTVDELPARPQKVIPTADRELLDLAARALGAVHIEDVDGEEWLNLHFEDGSTIYHWNPLLHGDDALELAVRRKLSIDVTEDAVCVIAGDNEHVVIEKGVGAALLPATRLAIARAAAEIGKGIAC